MFTVLFFDVFDIHFSFKYLRKFVLGESENKLPTDWSQGSLLQPNYPDLGGDIVISKEFLCLSSDVISWEHQ